MSITNKIKNIFGGGTKPSPQIEQFSPEQYITALEEQRTQKDQKFRDSPHPFEDKTAFSGLQYYPPDPAFRFILPLQKEQKPEKITVHTNTNDDRVYYRIGKVEFQVEGETATLSVYSSNSHNDDDLFIPYRDTTSGQESYGAGRYLEPVDLGGGNLLIDFNLAYNPFCAYSDSYSCPLPPFENHLKVAIKAGEKSYKTK